MNRLESRLRQLPGAQFTDSLSSRVNEAAARLAPTLVAPGPTIGVIADTHCARAEDLHEEVLNVFADVDLIVHCGDIGTVGLLERLQQAAPVCAVRSGGDAPADGTVLFEGPRIVRAGALLFGVIAHVEVDSPEEIDALFGTQVDVVLTGTTHVAEIRRLESSSSGTRLIVNPGSPTLPRQAPPSVAIVEARPDGAAPRIVTVPRKEKRAT